MTEESFQVEPFYPEKGLPITKQIGQITGKLKNEADYGCPEYFKLMQAMVPLR